MTCERFMIKAQWDSTNKLCSPGAGMSSRKLVPVDWYWGWGGGVYLVQLRVNPRDTELCKGHRPLRPGRTDLNLCGSSSTKTTTSPIKMLLTTQQLCFSKPQMLCFPFSTTQSHLFPWFSISGPLSESEGRNWWGEKGSIENNWALMGKSLLLPYLDPSWLWAHVGRTSARAQRTDIG